LSVAFVHEKVSWDFVSGFVLTYDERPYHKYFSYPLNTEELKTIKRVFDSLY